jgi:hypothetical protein
MTPRLPVRFAAVSTLADRPGVRPLHRRVLAVLVAAVSLAIVASCGSASTSQDTGANPNSGGTGLETTGEASTGGERKVSPEERSVLVGIVTETNAAGDKGTIGRILVEEDPDARCPEGPTTPGCGKMTFTVNNETRVFVDKGCDGEGVDEASASDLAKGQRVRADHTGHIVKETAIGQTTARRVVICAGALDPAATPSPDSRVFFPHQRPVRIGYPDAELHGTLIMDDGCLRTKVSAGDPGTVPLWPANFDLDASGDEIQVVNGKDRVVARVGEEVSMGGGEVGKETLEENNILSEQTRRVLFERCPEDYYWLASPEGMHTGR